MNIWSEISEEDTPNVLYLMAHPEEGRGLKKLYNQTKGGVHENG